jgi:hypothetical protein
LNLFSAWVERRIPLKAGTLNLSDAVLAPQTSLEISVGAAAQSVVDSD